MGSQVDDGIALGRYVNESHGGDNRERLGRAETLGGLRNELRLFRTLKRAVACACARGKYFQTRARAAGTFPGDFYAVLAPARAAGAVARR